MTVIYINLSIIMTKRSDHGIYILEDQQNFPGTSCAIAILENFLQLKIKKLS